VSGGGGDSSSSSRRRRGTSLTVNSNYANHIFACSSSSGSVRLDAYIKISFGKYLMDLPTKKTCSFSSLFMTMG